MQTRSARGRATASLANDENPSPITEITVAMPLSLGAWKGLSMGVFTAISIAGAAIAVAVKENSRQLYVSSGVFFSAGVLLAGGFVHLLVDADEQFAEIGADGFPWAFAICGVTIVCLACVEMVLDRALGDYMAPGAGGDENDSGGSLNIDEEDHPYRGVHDHMHIHPGQLKSEKPFSAILLTLALSVHCIIEGVGIGASGDVSHITSAFIAITAHKGFTAFSLAEGMVSSGYWEDRGKRKYFYLSVGTFVGVTVLGIAAGWVISRGDEASALTAALISVTSGSFVYVALMEILPEEARKVQRERLPVPPVVLSFAAGFCLMALLALWV